MYKTVSSFPSKPKRIILAAAGNLRHEQVLEMLDDLIPFPETPYDFPPQPKPVVRQNNSLKEKKLEQVHICIGTEGLPQADDSRYAGYILNTILGSGISSRLFQSIREERGLAYSVYSYWSSYRDTGMLVVYAGTKRESATQVVDLVLREFRKMKREKVTTEELKNAKNQLKGNMMLGLESTVNRMSKLAKQEIYLGRQFTLSETLDAIEKVTEKDILELANRIMDEQYINIASIGPLKGLGLDKKPLQC